MIHAEHIDVGYLQDHPLDDPLGTASGAGVIFGATGGVMEAALRSAYYFVTGENADADAFANVRRYGWLEGNPHLKYRESRYDVLSSADSEIPADSSRPCAGRK